MRLQHWPILICLLCLPLAGQATVVRLQTSLGTIDVELYDSLAPLTVANFLRYVNSGAYNNSFIHRSVPGFIVQGGGYVWDNSNGATAVAVSAAVANEYGAARSNLRGTIAMAKVGGNPNSATSQWFINLADNSANLDNQNGGFTVFGQVLDDGMQVVDAIAALATVNAGGDFTTLPVTSVPSSGLIGQAQLVMVSSASLALRLVAGWNLVGNAVEAPIAVAQTFHDASKVNSVWKWDGNRARWAFYSPSLSDGGAAYANSAGYSALATVAAGEGYWVNALAAWSLALATGTAVQASSFRPAQPNPATPGGAHALPSGWSLIATGDNPNPSQFAAAIATRNSTAPATGQVNTSLTSLWAWNAAQQRWYFWAPSLVNSGGLSSYIGSRQYLDFANMPSTPSGTLSPTSGFWVNIP